MDKWMPALQIIGIGFYIAACIGGGISLGWWLGGKQPLFIILGLLLGLALAFYGAYTMIKPLLNNKKKNGKGNG